MDIIAIPEPHLDFKGMTRASKEWIAVYPTSKGKEGPPKVRSPLLVSNKINSDSWEEVRTGSNDLTAIRIRTPGAWVLLANIYNDCKTDETLD